MNILVLTIPVTLTMVLLFILMFVVAAKSGQFNDLETPSHTPFLDEENENKQDKENNETQDRGQSCQ